MDNYIGKIQSPYNKNESIDSARLILNNGVIEIEFHSNRERLDNIKVLFGIFNGLGKVTLVNCQNIGMFVGAGGDIRKYNAEYLFEGCYLTNLDNCFFKKATVLQPGLLDWTNLSSVENKLFTRKTLEIEEVEPVEIYNSDEFLIEIFTSYKINLKRENNQITISESAGYRIISNKKDKNIWSYLNLIQELKKFFFILSNSRTHVESTTFYLDNDEPIRLHWSGNNSIGNPTFWSPQINFDQIKFDFHHIIQNWFDKKDLQTSVDLVLEKTSNTKLSVENFFLNNCFSIETFHRRFRNYRLFEKSKFRDIKKKIFDIDIDDDVKKMIEGNLAHMNQPNFRRRLEDFTSDFEVLLPQEWKISDYIKKIVKTRNYLVHRSSTENIFDRLEMRYAAFFIELIIKINIFRTLEISENIIDEILRDTGQKIRHSYDSNK